MAKESPSVSLSSVKRLPISVKTVGGTYEIKEVTKEIAWKHNQKSCYSFIASFLQYEYVVSANKQQ